MMNYFELFEIPIDLFPEESEIRAKYYQLSKKYHPDINQAPDPEAYMQLMEMSGRINTAYKTLIDFDQRLKYILEQHNALNEENEQLSPEFLMEMMELNERISAATTNEDNYKQILDELEAADQNSIAALRSIWSGLSSTEILPKELAELKAHYYQRKYLLRIRQNLNSFAGL